MQVYGVQRVNPRGIKGYIHRIYPDGPQEKVMQQKKRKW